MSKLTKKLKENLDTEISILKSLQHPHIVAMFSLVEKPVHFTLLWSTASFRTFRSL
jgi:serine/threonine-protein kinase ULK/ATG1